MGKRDANALATTTMYCYTPRPPTSPADNFSGTRLRFPSRVCMCQYCDLSDDANRTESRRQNYRARITHKARLAQKTKDRAVAQRNVLGTTACFASFDEPPIPDSEKYIVCSKNNIHGYNIKIVVFA